MNKPKTLSAAMGAGLDPLAQAAAAVLLAAVVIVLATRSAEAGGNPACGPGAGDCCSANWTPGCDDPECCNTVCGLDPWCCDNEWDPVCAAEAEYLCPACGPGPCQSDDNCLPGEVCVDGDCVDAGCPLPHCPGALDEGELCGTDTNGGCNSTPPIFTPASCGDTFCGTGWVVFHTRDTDWYMVDHIGGIISATLTSQFPGSCYIVGGVGPGGVPCDPYIAGDIGSSNHCQNLSVASADMPPGTVVVFVAAVVDGIPDGFPCGGANDYVLSIKCGPCIGDCEATPDGIVGIVDFLALLAQWGQVGAPCDFDGGGVGIPDFLILLASWGPCN